MVKTMFAALVAAGLIAAPLPVLTQNAAAQTQAATPAAPATKTAKPKKPPSAGQLAARERQKKPQRFNGKTRVRVEYRNDGQPYPIIGNGKEE